MLTESNEKDLGLDDQNMVCQIDVPASSPDVLKLKHVEWYSNIIFYLKNLTCPSHLIGHKRRALRLKASKYVIIKYGL